MICDNKANCHNPITVAEDMNALRVICKECKHQYVIRKEPFKNAPENRQYSNIFKRDVLQGNDNLLYKYYPQFMNQ